MAGSILMLLISLVFMATYFALLLAAVVSCMRNQPEQNRTAWVLVIIFFPLLGPLIYFAVAKKPALSKMRTKAEGVVFNAPPVIEPPFDHAAMHDEKQRAAAITETLLSKSKNPGSLKR